MAPIIDENLFERVLLKPAKDLKGLKDISLDIVSGYVTDKMAMAKRHMQKLHDNKTPVSRIRVAVGMEEIWNTHDLKYLTENYDLGCLEERNLYGDIKFECKIPHQKYHAKVYVWLAGGVPLEAFSGSANYTEKGIDPQGYKKQIEAMTETDPDQAYRFFKNAWHEGYYIFPV